MECREMVTIFRKKFSEVVYNELGINIDVKNIVVNHSHKKSISRFGPNYSSHFFEYYVSTNKYIMLDRVSVNNNQLIALNFDGNVFQYSNLPNQDPIHITKINMKEYLIKSFLIDNLINNI